MQTGVHSSKIIFIVIAAAIASLGTMPYGFRFAEGLIPNHQYLLYFVGIILAVTAAFANFALGFYSLLNMQIKWGQVKYFYLIILSVLSSIPNGFMCYFAYNKSFPFLINLVITGLVTIMNIAIAHTAIFNFFSSLNEKNLLQLNFQEQIIRIIAFIIGIGVSLSIYMVTIHGITSVFLLKQFNEADAYRLSEIIGFITWIPLAALFSNSTQVTAGQFYQFIRNFSVERKNVSMISILILCIALCSGASFAQIAIEFFNPQMNIPDLLKNPDVQMFIYYFLIPFAFVSSAAVNYLGLKNAIRIGMSLIIG